jgi:hypothetical protein
MEPESTLPRSQKHTTRHYPEPDQSSAGPACPLSLKIYFLVIKKEVVKGRPGSGDKADDNYKVQAQPFDGIAILPGLRWLHVRNRHQNAPL